MSAVRVVRLTDSELRHLLGALAWASEEGSYYGNRRQYEARHLSVKRKLENALTQPTKAKSGTP